MVNLFLIYFILLGDGCSKDCQIENGYICSGKPSICGSLLLNYIII